jgi:hypothetical protein
MGSDELPPSMNLLFDESINNYYTGEETSVLGSLLTIRLIQASKLI